MRGHSGKMKSYSSKTKEYLLETKEKKKCCARMLDDIRRLGGTEDPKERAGVLEASPVHFKCPGCFAAYLKGLFLVYGNVTDPAKRYHLELSFPTAEERDAAQKVISENSFSMTCGQRNKRFLLYVKSSAAIEDFFALVGANRSVFDLMNSKIVKELKSQTNRQLNCDMANIRKTLRSAQPYIDAVNELEKSGGIVRLPPELRETARLRLENPQASMSDMALMHNPPISKSGVKHRLDKIMEIYEGFEKE